MKKSSGSLKRILVGILCFSFLLSFIPAFGSTSEVVNADEVNSASDANDLNDGNDGTDTKAFPASDDTDQSEGGKGANDIGDFGSNFDKDLSKTASESDAYSVTRVDSAPAYSAFSGMSEWLQREIIAAPDNTYSMKIATGASSGAGVVYIGVRYTDVSGKPGVKYIFPNIDATERSTALLNSAANGKDLTKTFGAKILEKYHYKEDLSKADPLASWSVQDFVFQTESEIADVTSVEIYLESAGNSPAKEGSKAGSWSFEGMSLYKVNNYKGYEEYGMVSGQQFLDYEGYLMAEVKSANKAALSTSGTDSVFVAGENGNSVLSLETYKAEENEKKFSSEDDLYTFRMDFADTSTAGIESLVNYEALPMSQDNGLVEDIALEVQYKDIHGWNRKITLPVLLSSYATIAASGQDQVLFGIAQRGDTIAFQGMLPEYDSINRVVVAAGESARQKIAENGIVISNATAKMNASLAATASDEISIAGMSIYKGGCNAYFPTGRDTAGNTLKGANAEFVFESQSPLMYYVTTEIKGRVINGGTSEDIKFRKYSGNASLIPTEYGRGMFLMTFGTSPKKPAGTEDDINFRINYKSMDKTSSMTPIYRCKEAQEEYMGNWPTDKGGSFLKETGFVPGGKVSFLINIEDFSEFTGAEVSLTGKDEWIMDSFTIDYVEKYEKRMIYLSSVQAVGVKSNYWIERNETSARVFDLSGSDAIITDENGNIVNSAGEAEKKTTATSTDASDMSDTSDIRAPFKEQLIKGGHKYIITFDSAEVDIRDKDYSDIRYDMTYEDTLIDWGFFRKKKTYEIGVKVADDPEFDSGNGDSGSTNHFYFQLVFNNGKKSGYVLANQQISSDGFRSGKTEYFSIYVNQDYGELRSINIIPEDTTSDAEPFDKLNIEYITVSEDNAGGSYLTYMIADVGWIDIDYTDELEAVSSKGRKGRYESEIAKNFKVSEMARQVKLLCELTTGAKDPGYSQFVGSVRAEITYTNTKGVSGLTASMDVVKAMYSYMDEEPQYVEAEAGTSPKDIPAISDKRFMFRENHTDRFLLVPITDLFTVESIKFTAQTRDGNAAVLRIKNVTLSQVYSDGNLQMSANSEYIRNMETKSLCMAEYPNDKAAKEGVIAVQTLQAGKSADIGPIKFSPNKLVWKSDTWVTPVSRIPDSTNDVVNIILYPTAGSKNTSGASVDATLIYNVPFSKTMQVPYRGLREGRDAKGNTIYYVRGVKAANFIGASKLILQCVNENMSFSYGIVQHVREGVVLDNYSFEFNDASAVLSTFAYATDTSSRIEAMEETLSLSFTAGTADKNLISQENDIAVSFYYTSTLDMGNGEYQSPFVYFTDQNIMTLSEGLFAEIKYNIPFVKEITGYTIAGYGNVKASAPGAMDGANVNGAAAAVYDVVSSTTDPDTKLPVTTERKLRSYSGFNELYAVTERMIRHNVTSHEMSGENSVVPLEMTFETSEASYNLDSTTESAVRMTFNFRDYMGITKSIRYEDITKYIQDDRTAPQEGESSTVNNTKKAFTTGGKQTIKLFLPEMNRSLSLISVEILPYNAEIDKQVTEGGADMNTDASVDSDISTIGDGNERDIEDSDIQALLASRNAMWKIKSVECNLGLGSVVVSRQVDQEFVGIKGGGILRLNNVTLTTTVRTLNTEAVIENHIYQLAAKSGDKISGTAVITDSTSGVTIKAFEMVNDAPKDVTNDVVKAALKQGPVLTAYNLEVPENKTGKNVLYRVEISPVDAPDLVDVIAITVESDDIPVLNTSISKNGEDAISVTNGAAQLFAKSGDVITGLVGITDGGFSVKAYVISGTTKQDITASTVSMSETSKNAFKFLVPSNTTGDVITFQIVITSDDDPNVQDVITIAVESKEEDTTEEPTEDTTEESTEDTTEGTSEETSDDTSGDTSGGTDNPESEGN